MTNMPKPIAEDEYYQLMENLEVDENVNMPDIDTETILSRLRSDRNFNLIDGENSDFSQRIVKVFSKEVERNLSQSIGAIRIELVLALMKISKSNHDLVKKIYDGLGFDTVILGFIKAVFGADSDFYKHSLVKITRERRAEN